MADFEFQEGLSGPEIIEDFVDQIRRKLNMDCNLRGSDCYPSGYSGKATIELSLYGMDLAKVTVEVTSGAKKNEPSLSVEAEVEVPHEADLSVVRERASLPEPTLERNEESTPAATNKKRRYGKLPAITSGGATDEVVE